MRRTLLRAALLLVAAAPVATAQPSNNGPPGPPPASGTEVGNWGLVPFTVGPGIVLDERTRAQLRALEDRFAKELLELRARQAAERAALLGSAGR